MKYVLNDKKEPVIEHDLMKWGKWFQTADRQVAEAMVGDARISTVFLGLDHDHFGKGDPVLWETMVFGGPYDGVMDRCSGEWADAEAMHKRMLARVDLSAGCVNFMSAWWKKTLSGGRNTGGDSISRNGRSGESRGRCQLGQSHDQCKVKFLAALTTF